MTVHVVDPPAAEPGCGPLRALGAAQARPLRRQVFDCVRAAGLIARIDVAKALGVSPGSVSAIAAELIEAGLIREADAPPRDGDAVRGRPPVALAIRGAAGHVVGVKLSDDAHSAVVIDLAGETVASARIARGARRRGAEAVAAEAVAVVDAALRRAGMGRRDVAGVGLGLPGVVRHDSGAALWSPILAERDAPFGPDLARRLGVEVRLDNDANAFTLAELWFGAGRALSDFAVVTIERGLGMGLVLDDRLYRGARGLGTEFGHTKVQLDGALCRCGRRGCLEAYVADYALVREASTALDWENRAAGTDADLLGHLYAQAAAGDDEARTIFRRAGRYLAIGLANVATLFDPPLIVLAGERVRHDLLYGEAVVEDMRRLTLDTGRPPPRIELHDWGDLMWARGAATMALESATERALAGAEAAA